jgi:hypothetical protein
MLSQVMLATQMHPRQRLMIAIRVVVKLCLGIATDLTRLSLD